LAGPRHALRALQRAGLPRAERPDRRRPADAGPAGEGGARRMSLPQPPVRAPALDRPGLLWLNVARPLGLAELAGRVVLLDFWTFCCINCLQILPSLARLEAAFPTELAVIGVHSPKFPAERDPEKLR